MLRIYSDVNKLKQLDWTIVLLSRFLLNFDVFRNKYKLVHCIDQVFDKINIYFGLMANSFHFDLFRFFDERNLFNRFIKNSKN